MTHWLIWGSIILHAVELPTGKAPVPLSFPHFPSRLYTFIWRNWELVPVERIARTVNASPDQIRNIATSMGLSKQPAFSTKWPEHSYITIIRSNWHLLPYSQLLTLLGWTPEHLAFTLKEDDFLFIKLGRLKPACKPIQYHEPTDQERQRAAEISSITQTLPKPEHSEPLLSFIRNLSSPPSSSKSFPTNCRFSPRFCSSYFGATGDPLLDDTLGSFPEGYLQHLRNSGVDSIWLPVVLYKLTPFPWEPALSDQYEKRLNNLKQLVQRAHRYNMGVYLYLNEPRAMPLTFFKKHPELKGVQEGGYASLCTSVPEVHQYLRDAISKICRRVPFLAGFFTITASENLTNCWSHHRGNQCPRCSTLGPETVIADVNRAITEGIHDASSRARLLVWDWGWTDSWISGIIHQLPQDVSVMSVSEWAIPINRGGIATTVGEYAISVIGPGPRARRTWKLAAQAGLPGIAKIQANNTWELAAVPYIPAVANVAQHIANLRDTPVRGIMLGWTLGGCPSPNLEIVSLMGENTEIPPATALQKVAEHRYGKAWAPFILRAWNQCSQAFQEFPYHGGVLYHAPLQMGPANLLWPTATHYRATMVGLPYDDLDSWRSIYPPDIFIQQLRKVAKGFQEGLATLENATVPMPKTQQFIKNIQQEKRIMEACAIHFQSVADQSHFILCRNLLQTCIEPGEKQELIRELRELLEKEIQHATRLRYLQMEDSRLGFEASNHYFYTPCDLAEKVINCHYLLHSWHSLN